MSDVFPNGVQVQPWKYDDSLFEVVLTPEWGSEDYWDRLAWDGKTWTQDCLEAGLFPRFTALRLAALVSHGCGESNLERAEEGQLDLMVATGAMYPDKERSNS